MSERSIGSHPGAGVFRSTLVIIIILVCVGAFFRSTDQINVEVERVAAKRVVTEMRQALAMMLYDYAIKGQLRDLQKFDTENPFVPLAIYRNLPRSYRGVVSGPAMIDKHGWYFDRSARVAIYRFQNGADIDHNFRLVFVFEDQDGDQKYGPGDLGYLQLKKAGSG